MQWRQVDFEARRVILDPGTTKNDQARTFPLTQELRELLLAEKALTEELQLKKKRLIP
jgi:integrase